MEHSTGVPGEYVESFVGGCHGDELQERHAEAGVAWLRCDVRWGDVEPEPGEYDFERWDRVVERADELGLDVMPILDYTAPWASEATAEDDRDPRKAPPDPDAWRSFVETFVERYPTLTHYEVWNEPNHPKFLATDEPNHEVYVERILEPAAAVLHAHGKNVVAPSLTHVSTELIDRWLSYDDAWQHVDYLSVHYLNGDVDRSTRRRRRDETMVDIYEHVYTHYIRHGRLDGIWNTEEGLTGHWARGQAVTLRDWERPPYGQWVARYLLPVLEWALAHEWTETDDYRVFWYNLNATGHADDALWATNLVEPTDEGVELSEVGRALRTLTAQFAGAERVDTFAGSVTVGFGLDASRRPGPHFPTYAFSVDGDVFAAAWLDLPGIDAPRGDAVPLECAVGNPPESVDAVVAIDPFTGEETPIDEFAVEHGRLRFDLPRTATPLCYLRLRSAE